MISYVVQLAAKDEYLIPASNGYLLFSCLSKMLLDSPLDTVFHPGDDSGKKSVSISFLKRDTRNKHFSSDDLMISPGELLYARISFIRDSEGALFSELIQKQLGKTLRLGTVMFSLKKLYTPGEIAGALSLSDKRLYTTSPKISAGFHFISPTGFKRNGRQYFLPLPELIFGDLLNRWRLFIQADAFPELEESFSKIEIQNYNIETNAIKLRSDRIYRGFCGTVEYSFAQISESKQIALNALAGSSFFTGLGYKTSQGMGETWPFWRN